jgi:carboxyl-terminal processing protease
MPEGKSTERRTVSLIRDEIALDDQAANKGRIIEQRNREGAIVRLGIIDLPSFYAPMGADEAKKAAQAANTNRVTSGYASVDVARWLAKFKQEKVDGVILDLRGNGGGVLEEAIRLTGLFIREGPVVQAREWTGSVRVERDTDPAVVYDGPLVVLTSRFSASASEIVAAALQDYGRAIIVGDTSTHGKGTVQAVSYLSTLPQLSDPDPDKFGALKFTVRTFFRPTGISTQLRGVLPDIVLPSRLNYAKDIGESALENPLRTDPVQGARFEKLDLVQPYLSELLKRSSERVATNRDYDYVREDIELFRKQQADKTISLNEKERLKEQAEAEARQKAREKELRARPEPEEKVYEITLKEAALPGLPAPLQKTNSAALKARAAREALGTNTVSVATAMPAGSVDEADGADKPAVPDAAMNEAKQILMDYLRLRGADRGVSVVPAPKPAG